MREKRQKSIKTSSHVLKKSFGAVLLKLKIVNSVLLLSKFKFQKSYKVFLVHSFQSINLYLYSAKSQQSHLKALYT